MTSSIWTDFAVAAHVDRGTAVIPDWISQDGGGGIDLSVRIPAIMKLKWTDRYARLPPIPRIAAGLFLAALLSIAECRVFPQWVTQAALISAALTPDCDSHSELSR